MSKIFKIPKDRDLKISVVDDEEYYLNLIKVNLNKMGYKDVKIFDDVEDFLLSILSDKPDCVILDYILKDDMNGRDVLNNIKKIDDNIEVIMLSGQEDIEIATSIIKNGASDYVVKNKMSFFNIGNTLSKLNKFINTNEKSKWKSRRIKTLYIILIFIVWIIGSVILYNNIKNGFIF